ncbi:helix-turn-helix domain-containing protein [Sediminitomix flava]|uniref:AraC-like DNA-binding protein n=1 Tax=Sediminitomix flava TaxID=379075 RepID=A0A315Z8Z2_SEDFL|nr:AraC family transcriptional regulator [Sediminitomix flava]PWJ41762.1 AraC-like DNA-binding protein [Sediminitomix flava]
MLELIYQEANIEQLFEVLTKELKRDARDGNHFLYTQDDSFIHFYFYKLIQGFDVFLSNCKYKEDIHTQRLPDNDPDLIFINIVRIGDVSHELVNEEGQKHLDADSQKRILIYNGMYPIETYFKANTHFQSLGYYVSKEAFFELMPDHQSVFRKLFPGTEGLAYYTFLPIELNPLLDDVFHLREKVIGSNPLILARALEIFALLFQSIIGMLDKDDLNGLHYDDYQRLLKIRTVLSGNFDQKIVIDDLAKEFGVSVSKLQRDFKILFNSTIYQYHLNEKMEEAYRRLKSGTQSITEVSMDMGYENPSKFSAMFKKIKGMNPNEVLISK